jgi:hypothetical protein
MTTGPLSDVPDDEEQIADLLWHWDTAYEVSRSCETWTARFLTGTETLSAGSADELRQMIRADYLARRTAAASDFAPPEGSGREIGAGERALRRLRDEGVI